MYKLKDFSREVWIDNYKAPTENVIEDFWKRLADAGASIETNKDEWSEKFYKAFEDFKLVAGGRICANLGVEERKGTTLFNCFTHNPIDIERIKDPDSIEGIFELVKSQALTLKSEGGYGTNFSYLRPEGTYIKGIGSRSPGVLRFMDIWDKVSEIITSGTDKKFGKEQKYEKNKIRKGAMMGIISVWHPSVIEFIDAKLKEGKLTKFNLSVGITKGFMKAVENDEDWDLIFPDINHEAYETEWKGDIDKWLEKDYPVIVYETHKARDIWEKITKATYTRNEPGVMFLDLANELNPLYYGENILQSNPCVSGDTLVETNNGQIRIDELVELYEKGEANEIKILSYNTQTKTVEEKDLEWGGLTRKDSELIELELDGGEIVKLTPDHKVYTENRGYIKAKDLTEEDIIYSL
jgi:ribonucleoside-diphosphate reductase alpha chain